MQPDPGSRVLNGTRHRLCPLPASEPDHGKKQGGFRVSRLNLHSHDGQVFVRDGRYLLLDWGDACVSQPFFSLAVTLEGGIAWGLDDVQGSVDVAPFRAAYLEPFARAGSDLVAAAVLASRLGWVCRAVNGHVLGDLDGTRVRLRMFDDGHP